MRTNTDKPTYLFSSVLTLPSLQQSKTIKFPLQKFSIEARTLDKKVGRHINEKTVWKMIIFYQRRPYTHTLTAVIMSTPCFFVRSLICAFAQFPWSL